jgi:hypothetical protein
MLFRAGGQLRVAVIVKATFVIAPDRAMVRIDPEPLLRADRHADKDPLRSVIAASDRVPVGGHEDPQEFAPRAPQKSGRRNLTVAGI